MAKPERDDDPDGEFAESLALFTRTGEGDGVVARGDVHDPRWGAEEDEEPRLSARGASGVGGVRAPALGGAPAGPTLEGEDRGGEVLLKRAGGVARGAEAQQAGLGDDDERAHAQPPHHGVELVRLVARERVHPSPEARRSAG